MPFRGAANLFVALSVAICGESMCSRALCAGKQRETNPLITAVHVDGSTRSGELQAISDASITLVGDASRQLPMSDLVALQFAAPPIRRSSGALVQLANEDQLHVKPKRMDENSLTAGWTQFPAWPAVDVPLETVRAVAFSDLDASGLRREFLDLISSRGNAGDVIVLNNGDRISGELTKLDDNRFSIQTADGNREIALADVRMLAFDPRLVSFPSSPPKRVLVTLSDGSRLTAGNLQLAEDGSLRFDAAFGPKMAVPLAAVASLRVLGGRAVYLSDLEPADYRHTPYLSMGWPLARDRNVTGAPLRIGGAEYAKGLGMHTKSSVSYRLGGEYRQFRAVVAIDDQSKGQGSATFAVDVDGKTLFTSDTVTGKSSPQTVGPLDMRGAQTLTLTVDFADFGDIGDHADWCDALVVK